MNVLDYDQAVSALPEEYRSTDTLIGEYAGTLLAAHQDHPALAYDAIEGEWVTVPQVGTGA